MTSRHAANCPCLPSCQTLWQYLKRRPSYCDLGIVIDSQLSFCEHVTKIARNAQQRASLIYRCFTTKRRDLLVKAFITYVRPILEFNSPVWSPSTITCVNSLESVQRSFTKRLPGFYKYSYELWNSFTNARVRTTWNKAHTCWSYHVL